jgi:hypothetical protein
MYIWQDTLSDIYHKIQSFNDVYFPTVAKNNGSAGQGDTCEKHVFGIERNNNQGADYRGCELKTTTGRSLTLRPFTMKGGQENYIRDNWGVWSKDGHLCFNRSFKVGVTKTIASRNGKNTNTSLVVRLTPEGTPDALVLLFDEEEVGVWDVAEIARLAIDKMPHLCVIKADKKSYGIDCYRYQSFTFYADLIVDAFMQQLYEGKIVIEFRNRKKDYGTCFKISKKALGVIFRQVITMTEHEEKITS